MREIKYRFAKLDEVIVDIKNLSRDENEGSQDYHCLSCSRLLTPVLGQLRQSHFRHKEETVGCSYETYLHRTAKHFLLDSYRNCLASNIPFDIIAATRVCNHFEDEYLITCDLAGDYLNYDLTIKFQQIELEAREGSFVPDLLLSSLNGDKLFLEIAVNHKSQQDKIASGYPIIEIAIESEEDIARYCSHPLRESGKINFINIKNLLTADFCFGRCSQVKPCSSDILPYRCFYVTEDGRSFQRDRLKFDDVEFIRNEEDVIYTGVEVDTGEGDLALLRNTEKAFFELLKAGKTFKSCILCRYRILHTDSSCMPEVYRDAQIYCQLIKEVVSHEKASYCPKFKCDRDLFPVTGNANFKPFRKKSPSSEPSPYQRDILEWLDNPSGNLLCNALAGSGKSTTLMMIAEKLVHLGYGRERIKVGVYTKNNKNDLISKFGKQWENSISTFHSVGYKMLLDFLSVKNLHLDENKYYKISHELDIFSNFQDPVMKATKLRTFVKLIDMLRLNLGSEKSLEELAAFHCLDVELTLTDDLRQRVSQVLSSGEKAARESASVDFTDMVYLPVHWSMHGSNCFENFSLDWILVDECQDLSPTTLEFWLRLAGATAEGSHPQSHRPLKVGERMTGRLIFVGDRHQAIMGFAGSDDKMIETVKNKTGATELPLSICYRCPSSHLNLVNKIFPDIGIEAETNALFGEICVIPESKLYDKSKTCYLRVRDLVISRKRASLIRLFFDLLKRGVKTRLKGIDFDDIKSTILKINNLQGFGYDNFLEFLEIYKKQHLEKWKNSEALDYLKQDLDDTLSIIKIVYFEFNDCDSVNELCSRLENILKDDKSPLPILMTCHSAKGAESDRVFIYYPQDLPLLWEGQPEWMYAQELNLLYVSLTRSRHSLYLICDEKVLPKDPFWFIEVSKHYSENTIRQSLQSLFPTKLKQEFAVDRKDPQNHEALNIKQLDLFEEKPTASSSEIKRYIKTLSLILMEDFNGKIVRIYDIYKHYRDSQLTKSYRLDEIQSALSELEESVRTDYSLFLIENLTAHLLLKL